MSGNFEFAYNLGGGNLPPQLWKLPVAASQTIVEGDALTITSSQLVKAGDGDVIAAIAQEDAASLAAGTEIDVLVPQPWQVWRAVASADASSNVLDGTDTYDLTAAQLVNLADTTGGGLRIVAIDPDTNTDIYVQITNAFFGA